MTAAPPPLPWPAPLLAALTGGTAVGHWRALGIALEAGAARPGDLVVLDDPTPAAVGTALARGAAAVMTARAAQPLPARVPQLRVANLPAARALLPPPRRARAIVLGIAGGFGAPMVAAMLEAMLRRQMRVVLLSPDSPGPSPDADVALLALTDRAPPLTCDLLVAAGTDDPAALAPARALRVHRTGHLTVAEVAVDGVRLLIRLATAAPHALDAALAALAAVRALGADGALAALDLSAWRPGPGQGVHHRIALDPVEEAGFDLLDAAGPTAPGAVAAALAHLAAVAPRRRGRRIAVLTAPPPPGAGLEVADIVHTLGPATAGLLRNLPVRQHGQHLRPVAPLAPALRRLVHPGDVVLVAGGPEAAGVVDGIRKLGHRDRHAAQEVV